MVLHFQWLQKKSKGEWYFATRKDKIRSKVLLEPGRDFCLMRTLCLWLCGLQSNGWRTCENLGLRRLNIDDPASSTSFADPWPSELLCGSHRGILGWLVFFFKIDFDLCVSVYVHTCRWSWTQEAANSLELELPGPWTSQTRVLESSIH